MEFVYATGGREKYFKATHVSDCVTRAICNATGKDYKEVYNRLNELAKRERRKGTSRSSARNGVFKETWKKYLKELGWIHHSTCSIGSRKNKVKFVDGALPQGTLIVQLSKHLTCLKDGVIYDTYDCSKRTYYDLDGNSIVNDERCVYGYWTAPTEEQQEARQKELQKKQDLQDAIESIKQRYRKSLTSLKAKIKKLQHQLVLEENRMKREIIKLKSTKED